MLLLCGTTQRAAQNNTRLLGRVPIFASRFSLKPVVEVGGEYEWEPLVHASSVWGLGVHKGITPRKWPLYAPLGLNVRT